MSTDPIRQTTTLGELTPGQHISTASGISRVAHVTPYRDGDGRPQLAVTLIPLQGGTPPWLRCGSPDDTDQVATDAEVAGHTEAGRRNLLAAALRELADAIVARELPVPEYTFHVGGCVESRAEVEVWAEHLGVEVVMGGGGDIPVAKVQRLIGGRQALHISFQGPPEPTPEPLSLDNAIATAEALEPKPTGELAPCGCHIFEIPTEGWSSRVLHDTDCRSRLEIPTQPAGE